MNTFIVHPKTEEQTKALKAALKALEVEFESDENLQSKEMIPQHIVKEIEISKKEFEDGKWYSHEEVMAEFRKYL